MKIQRKWMKKRAWTVGIFLLLTVIFLFSSAPALASSGPKMAYPKPFATRMTGQHSLAVAVTCSRNTCNGLDPYQTGCAQSFYPATSKEIYPLLVELEYSRICHTNWTQAYWLDRSTSGGWGVSIERFAGPDGPDWYQVYWTPTRQWWINGNQVYAPVNKSQACEIAAPVNPITICTDKKLG